MPSDGAELRRNPFGPAQAALIVDVPRARFLPLAPLARVTIPILGLNALLAAIRVPDAVLLFVRGVGPLVDGTPPDAGEPASALSTASLLPSWLGCVAFCVWFYYAYRNLNALGHPTRHRAIWAPSSFFVPVLNMLWPLRIAREICSASTVGCERLPSLWWWSLLVPELMAIAALVVPLPFLVLGPMALLSPVLLTVSGIAGAMMVNIVSREQSARAMEARDLERSRARTAL